MNILPSCRNAELWELLDQKHHFPKDQFRGDSLIHQLKRLGLQGGLTANAILSMAYQIESQANSDKKSAYTR